MNYLYLDIETIPCQNEKLCVELVENAKPPSNYKNPETIAKWREENAADIIAKTSFDGALGEICAIGWSFGSSVNVHHQRMYDNKSELGLLEGWVSVLNANAGNLAPVVVGHNVNRFDIRFIWQRAIVHSVKLPTWFPKDPKPWGGDSFDTMTAWAGAGNMISLDNLSKALGLPGKSDVDGSMIAQMWSDGKHKEIAEYCASDVQKVQAIHQKMQRAGL